MDASSLGSTRLLGASNISTEDIKTLIAQKERELHDINEFRQQGLESIAAGLERENGELRNKINKMKEDFQYNLKLFEERDAELDRLESMVSELTSTVASKSTEAANLQAQLSEARARADAERSRVSDLETFYSEQLKNLRDSIEAARRAREEETRKWRLDYEAAREGYEARLAAREAEFDAHRREISEAADAAVTAMQRETRRREEQATAAVNDANGKLQGALQAAEEARNQASSLAAALDATRHALRASEADAAEARAEVDATRAEFEEALRGLAAEKDSATASKQALLDQYEARMNELLNSLRQVQTAFQQEKDEHERRIATVESEAASSTREYAALMEARLQALVVRLSEAEGSAKTNEDVAQRAKVLADEANQRATIAEAKCADLQREFNRLKEDSQTSGTLTKAQYEAASGQVRSLQGELDAANSMIARLRADITAAEHKVTELQEENRSINSTWQKRWDAREGIITTTREEQLVAVTAQRDLLAQQLRTALIAAGNASAAASLTNTAALAIQNSEAKSGLASAALLQSKHHDGPTDVHDVRSSGQFLANALQSREDRLNELVDNVHQLEEELGNARSECSRLREALSQSRGQIAALQSRSVPGQATLAQMPIPMYGSVDVDKHAISNSSSSLSSHFTGDLGPASPPNALWSSSTHPQRAVGAARASEDQLREVEHLRSRCAELEGQTIAFKNVISDMRSHMELLQQQLDTAQRESSPSAPGVSDAVLLQRCTLAESEREDISKELSQAQEYIRLLQHRAEAVYNSTTSSAELANDEHAELVMLRGHVRALGESTAQLRSRLRQVQIELTQARSATAPGASPAAENLTAMTPTNIVTPTSTASAGKAADPELQNKLQAANTDVQRLLQEREKLLELSNQLRADLNKALTKGTATLGPSGRRDPERGHVEAVKVAPPPKHQEPADIVFNAQAASRMAYLESALVSLSEQNAQLQHEVRRLADGARRQYHSERQDFEDSEDTHRHVSVQSVPAPPPQPPARAHSATRQPMDTGVSAVRGRPLTELPHAADGASSRTLTAEPRSPSRSRLDAAKRRLADAANPWVVSGTAIQPVDDFVSGPAGGSSLSRVVAPINTGVRTSQTKINPRYTQAALAARSEDTSRGSRIITARTPTPTRPTSPAEKGALAGQIGASVGATAAAVALEKAKQASAVTARVRNYNDRAY